MFWRRRGKEPDKPSADPRRRVAVSDTQPTQPQPLMSDQAKGQSIFISYRRSSALIVEHIHEKLSARFIEKSIFLDRADIEPGALFPDRIREALASTKIVLAMIGPDWIRVQNENTYRRRLDEENDWVRIELEIALSGKALVIPVLFDGAETPKPQQLPESLTKIATLQAFRLTRDSFGEDVKRLVDYVADKLGPDQARRLQSSDVQTRYPTVGPSMSQPLKPLPLTEEQLQALPEQLPHWRIVSTEVSDDPQFVGGYLKVELLRDFKFKSFKDAIRFMVEVSQSIDDIGHHPRWQNIFRTVSVAYSTWDIGHRLSDRDVKCAIMLEKRYKDFVPQK